MIKLKLTALAIGMAVASSAYATPFFLQAGSYGTTSGGSSDANTVTNSLESLGWTDSIATSIYFGLTPGSTVIDTNDISFMGTLGIPGYPNPEGRQIKTLNATSSLGDAENFTQTSADWGDAFRGGAFWGMTYTYRLFGNINAAGTGVDFTSGYFDLFHEGDAVGTATTQVARLNLGSFSLVSGVGAIYTVLASGNFSFDWTGDGVSDASAFAKDFFIDAVTGESYFDRWANGGTVNPLAISWRMDNNIDCPVGQTDCSGVPLPSQLTLISDSGGDR